MQFFVKYLELGLAGLDEGQTIIISDLAQFEGAETVLLQN
jgi:hypothetical protein